MRIPYDREPQRTYWIVDIALKTLLICCLLMAAAVGASVGAAFYVALLI